MIIKNLLRDISENENSLDGFAPGTAGEKIENAVWTRATMRKALVRSHCQAVHRLTILARRRAATGGADAEAPETTPSTRRSLNARQPDPATAP